MHYKDDSFHGLKVSLLELIIKLKLGVFSPKCGEGNRGIIFYNYDIPNICDSCFDYVRTFFIKDVYVFLIYFHSLSFEFSATKTMIRIDIIFRFN